MIKKPSPMDICRSWVLCHFFIYSYSQEKKAEYDRRYGSMKTVVVAARDIAHLETVDNTP